jgi:hypothetical protein
MFGKQPHLEFCRKELEKVIANNRTLNSNNGLFKKDSKAHPYFENSNIFLIDDDINNINIALQNGHYAFRVDEYRTLELDHLVKFLSDTVKNHEYLK